MFDCVLCGKETEFYSEAGFPVSLRTRTGNPICPRCAETRPFEYLGAALTDAQIWAIHEGVDALSRIQTDNAKGAAAQLLGLLGPRKAKP